MTKEVGAALEGVGAEELQPKRTVGSGPGRRPGRCCWVCAGEPDAEKHRPQGGRTL